MIQLLRIIGDMINYLFRDLIKLVSNPKKFFETKKILSDIEITLGENFDTDLVVLTKADFDGIINSSRQLKPDAKFNKNTSSTEVIYDYYSDYDSYYGDDTFTANLTADLDQKFKLKTHSVFNFASVYIFGNRHSNVITIFSLDEKDQLYIYDQKEFKLKTHSDVIDACDSISKEYELDTIIFTKTDVMGNMYNNVIGGLKDKSVNIELYKEFIHFNDSIEELLPMLNSGNILINAGESWYIHLQNEITRYFNNTMPSPTQKAPSSIVLPYPKLKSMTYGVHYWNTYKGTKKLQRIFNEK